MRLSARGLSNVDLQRRELEKFNGNGKLHRAQDVVGAVALEPGNRLGLPQELARLVSPLSKPAGLPRTELIISRYAFECLRSEWTELLKLSPDRSIFLTWEWVSAWLETVRPDAPLRIVTVRDDHGRLSALAPFYEDDLVVAGRRFRRCLRVLGDEASGAEYGDIIALPDGPAPRAAVLRFLRENWTDWDIAWLPKMGPTTVAPMALLDAARGTGLLACSRPRPFSRITLSGSFDAYLAELPGKVRYQTRQGLNRLRKSHGARLEEATAANLDQALDDLFRLHAKRWSVRGKPGAFADPTLRAFVRALAERMLHQGWFRLDRACINGEAVAAQVGFSHGDTFYELQRGFDPEFPNIPGGVGAALRSMVLERCVGEGLRAYDFLGGFTGHKRRAGARCLWGRDVMVFQPSSLNRLLLRAGLWPTGRYLGFASNGGRRRQS